MGETYFFSKPINRRKFLKVAATVIACGGCAGMPTPSPVAERRPLTREESIAAWRGRICAILARRVLPIIDTEATFSWIYDLQFILREMEANGVAQIAFAPIYRFFGGSTDSLALHEKYPAFFIPTTSDGVTPDWWNNPEGFVEAIISEVLSGKYFFMGEFEFRHYPSPMQYRSGKMFRDVTVSLDRPAAHRLFSFSQDSGTAFMIHYEIEDVLLPPLEAMLGRYPGARVIWCHLGQVRYSWRARHYGPTYIRSLIAKSPNLYFDLGLGGPGHVYPGSNERDQTIYEFTGIPPYGGRLKREWQAILEDFPERFLAATDIDPHRFQSFPHSIRRLRWLVLDELSERARHLIAYKNAWRLITKEAWKL
jgi:hypothetical protein